MDEKLKNKLEKLYVVSQRGSTYNERETAGALLEQLLLKHNVTLSFITDETTEVYEFKHKNGPEYRLLIQVVAMVLNPKDGQINFWEIGNTTKQFELTRLQYQEISYFYEIYRVELKKQMEEFVSAFFVKNNICSDSWTEVELSLEEQLRRQRIMELASGIKKVDVHLAIEDNR